MNSRWNTEIRSALRPGKASLPPQLYEGHGCAASPLRPARSGHEPPRIGRRSQEMRCFQQTGEFLRGYERDVPAAPAADDDDFAVIDHAIQNTVQIRP